jgi:hypothetical protein
MATAVDFLGTAASRAEKMESEKHLTRKQPFLEPEKGLNEQGLVLQSSFYFLDVLNLCFCFLAFLLLLVTNFLFLHFFFCFIFFC